MRRGRYAADSAGGIWRGAWDMGADWEGLVRCSRDAAGREGPGSPLCDVRDDTGGVDQAGG